MYTVGSVPFLNAKPLIWALDPGRVKVVLAPPPRLRDLLEAGELDAALLSSIEYLRHKDRYGYIPGLGICSDGHVDSVRLYHRVDLPRIRTIRLDPHSLTANALARIILKRRFNLTPAVIDRPADATVVIGDRSFRFADLPFVDLGAEWKALTGLPFVFAMWIYRKPLKRGLAALLQAAARHGLRRVGEIARREAARLELDRKFCATYLRKYVRYRVGPAERRALALFGSFVRRYGL